MAEWLDSQRCGADVCAVAVCVERDARCGGAARREGRAAAHHDSHLQEQRGPHHQGTYHSAPYATLEQLNTM